MPTKYIILTLWCFMVLCISLSHQQFGNFDFSKMQSMICSDRIAQCDKHIPKRVDGEYEYDDSASVFCNVYRLSEQASKMTQKEITQAISDKGIEITTCIEEILKPVNRDDVKAELKDFAECSTKAFMAHIEL